MWLSGLKLQHTKLAAASPVKSICQSNWQGFQTQDMNWDDQEHMSTIQFEQVWEVNVLTNKFWGLNSCPHVCRISTFPTELAPQPCILNNQHLHAILGVKVADLNFNNNCYCIKNHLQCLLSTNKHKYMIRQVLHGNCEKGHGRKTYYS